MGKVSCFFLSSADFFFSKSSFSKNYFKITIRVSNRLGPDQARQNVGPDLGPNCLQRLSAVDKDLKYFIFLNNINSYTVHMPGLFPAILGKGPWPKLGKNDRLNIKIGRN